MLSVYMRHYPPCPQVNTRFRDCRCPKWLQGTIWPHPEWIRRSAQTRRWATAEQLARAIEREADESVRSLHSVTVETAIQELLREQEAKKLTMPTLRKDRIFLVRQLLAWCAGRNLKYLKQLGAVELRNFPMSWGNHAWTARWKHERLRHLFAFSIHNGWLAANPMDMLEKPPIPKRTPTDYFTREEVDQIVAATYRYSFGGGNDCHFRGARLRALVLLMRWSGLAIKDAVSVDRTRLDANGCLFLRRAKTNAAVFVPLPPKVAALLRALPCVNPNYFFWSGQGEARDAVKAYQRSFWKLFREANLTRPDGSPKRYHSHMFRDTFAVELLLAGVPIEQVSVLLGHSSVKMTEKHYLPWVKARQEQLTKNVQQAWFPEVL